MIHKVSINVWFLLASIGLILSMVVCRSGSEDVPTATPTPTLTPTSQPPTATADSGGSSTPSEEETTEPTSEPIVVPTATPTATSTASPTATPSPCEGLNGELEVRILVGPAAAVGLETHGVGSVPFSVTSGGAPYGVEGGGNISYHEILVEDEINYDVTFDTTIAVDGTCEDTPGSMQLALDLDMDWNQVVEVTARDFHEVYPVAGNNAVIVTLPLIDGATASVGEGAEVVLHLNQ
jgi:cytoskeletal protein RodZ